MNIVKTLGAFLLCQASWAGFEVIENTGEYDPYKLYNTIQAFVPQANELDPQNPNFNSQCLQRHNSTEKTPLEQFSNDLRKVVPLIKTAAHYAHDIHFLYNGYLMQRPIYGEESEADQKQRQIMLDSYNFLYHTLNEDHKIQFLQCIFPEGYITAKEWTAVRQALKKMKMVDAFDARYNTKPADFLKLKATLDDFVEKFTETDIDRNIERKRNSAPDVYYSSPEFIENLSEAAILIKASLQPGDTVVGVGNTPQYVMKALQHHLGDQKNLDDREKIRLIPIAVSGWPGINKGQADWVKNILTPKALPKYLTYMDNIGLNARTPHQRVFFLDIIGGGGGVEFMIHHFIDSLQRAAKPLPDIKIIALNDIGNVFTGRRYRVDAISLKMGALAQKLDRMSTSMRITPDFPAWRWDDITFNTNSSKPTLQRIISTTGVGAYALDVQDYIAQSLDHLKNGQSILPDYQIDSPPEGVTAERWAARMNQLFSHSAYTRQFIKKHFDLVNLYSDHNDQQMKDFLAKIQDDREYQRVHDNWQEFKKDSSVGADMDFIGSLEHLHDLLKK